jgi:hypothetical protein
MWFGREPAVFVGLVVGVINSLVVLFPLDSSITAAIVAVITAAGGAVVSLIVVQDGQLPALLGLVQAGLSLIVTLGTPLSDQYQMLILSAAQAIFMLVVRSSVTAPVSVHGEHVDAGVSVSRVAH